MIPSPGLLSLQPGQVHVWTCSGHTHLPNLWLECLPATERKLLQESGSAAHIKQRLTTRALLRYTLSAYEPRAASSWKFREQRLGKPVLVGRQLLQFNVSHTHEFSAIIISRTQAVGIDVEYCARRLPSADDFVLSDREKLILSKKTVDQQRELFFIYWTAKEALGKGLGRGLGFPLNHITVIRRGQSIALSEDRQPRSCKGWHLGTMHFPQHRLSWACAPHANDGHRRPTRRTIWQQNNVIVYRVA